MDPEEKKTWMIVGLIFVLFLAAIIAMPKIGLMGLLQEHRDNSSELIAKRLEVGESGKKVRELPKLRNRIDLMEEEIALYERRLPNSEDAGDLLKMLNDLGRMSGIQIDVTQRKKPVTHAKQGFKEIPVSLEFVGDYHDIGRFINEIERSDRFAKVDELNITYNDIDDDLFMPGVDPFYRQRCRCILSTFMFISGGGEKDQD